MQIQHANMSETFLDWDENEKHKMKTEKIATLTLEIAKQMYSSNVESLKQFALHHYTEEELTKKEFPKEYKKHYTTWGSGYCFNTRENAQAANKLGELICMRDLWWEIDGNWKPDWNVYNIKFAICTLTNKIDTANVISENKIFVFRTKEIRNEFLEPFRESLEICKSLI